MEDGRKDEEQISRLGHKLPFLDVYIVRGVKLRNILIRLGMAEFNTQLRSRMIGKMMARLHDEKGVPPT